MTPHSLKVTLHPIWCEHAFAAAHSLQVKLVDVQKPLVTNEKQVTKSQMLRVHGQNPVVQGNYDVYDEQDRMIGRCCIWFCAFDKYNPHTARSLRLEASIP